jgi:hypothetical protein
MGQGRMAERFRALGCEHHFGTSAVGGALLTPDQPSPFHAAELVRETAALPADADGQFGGAQPSPFLISQREEHDVGAR